MGFSIGIGCLAIAEEFGCVVVDHDLDCYAVGTDCTAFGLVAGATVGGALASSVERNWVRKNPVMTVREHRGSGG